MTLSALAKDSAPNKAHAPGQAARKALAAVADGNGLSAGQIRLVRETLDTYTLTGEISVALSSHPEKVLDDAFCARVQAELDRLPFHGWGCTAARIYVDGIDADVSFTLWRQGADALALSAVDALALGAANAPGLVALADAEIADIEIDPLVAEGSRLRSTCRVHLPAGQVDFSLEGRFVSALVAGKSPRIVALDPFLDRLIKPGVAALLKLSRGPLAVDSLLAMAMKYRLVRHALQALLYMPRKTVYARLKRDYPIGVSDKYLRATVSYAASAQEALLTAPRATGARLALGAGVCVAFVYFFFARMLIADPAVALGADLLLWLVLSVVGVFIVRWRARRGLMDLLRAPKVPKSLPSAAHYTQRLPVFLALCLLIVAALSPAPPPYAQPFARLIDAYIIAPMTAS